MEAVCAGRPAAREGSPSRGQPGEEGRKLQPIEIEGRTIARTFWGQAWCENLERYSDFANRLPRGRTYVRNGSVVDLQIAPGEVQALVSGSDIYTVRVAIATLPRPEWTKILHDCSQSIDSLMDLLAGRFSQGVMERLTRQNGGLFPQPKQIKLRCGESPGATPAATATATRTRRKRATASDETSNGSAAAKRAARRPRGRKPAAAEATKRPRAKAASARTATVKSAKAKPAAKRGKAASAKPKAKSPRVKKTPVE